MTNINYQELEKGALEVPTVGFKKLHGEAVLPVKAHDSDSGFDLYALEDTVVRPGETTIVKTGLAISLPEGLDATIRPRSGITAKTNLRVQLGTIDNDYVGELGVIVDNITCTMPKPVYDTLSNIIDVLANHKVFKDDSMLLVDLYSALNSSVMSDTYLNLKGEEVSTGGVIVTDGTYLIKKGDKIAQLVVHPYYDNNSIEVSELEDTVRGEGGFGSTGVSNG